MTNPACPYPEFIPFIDDDGDDDFATVLAVADNELTPTRAGRCHSDRLDD